MRKGPGFIARMYRTGRRSFLEAAKGYRIRGGINTIGGADFAEIEARTLSYFDFATAAAHTLAEVNADPYNHFGKWALRRFDK